MKPPPRIVDLRALKIILSHYSEDDSDPHDFLYGFSCAVITSILGNALGFSPLDPKESWAVHF